MNTAVRDATQPFPSPSIPSQPRATQPLADVLAALGDRVAPTTMARERTLSTTAELAELFAEGGLVRGRVLSCTGAAATSLALALLAPAVAAGAWVALVDVTTVGLDAACELGMPLERIVAIDTRRRADAREGDGAGTGGDAVAGRGAGTGGGAGTGAANDVAAGQRWADVVAAAADGFDVMIVRVPDGLRASTVRKVATRLQQRGVVMIVLGAPEPFACDGVIDTAAQVWSGLGDGWGHLRRRTVEVTATGRRFPGRRARTITLPTGPGRGDLPDALPDEPPAEQPARRLVVAGDLSTAC